jgi:Leucine-rich repeat (LRR) protein
MGNSCSDFPDLILEKFEQERILTNGYLKFECVRQSKSSSFKPTDNFVWLCKKNIESIDENAFHDISHFGMLNLSSNNLAQVSFGSKIKITSLYLISNMIEELNKSVFENVFDLVNLQLESNKIVSIENDTFETLVNLKSLNLSCNLIKELVEDLFQNLACLEELKLKSNKINKIDKNIFDEYTEY